MSFYPKAGLSISRYDINDPNSDYRRFEPLYDTSNQSKVLFNPLIGAGISWQLRKRLKLEFEYLHTFELDLNQALISLNYQY